MHIGIAGPLGTPDIEHMLDGDTRSLPREMKGATLLVTLIEALIRMGHEVSAFTTDPALVPRRGNTVIAQGHNLTVYYVPRRRHSLRFDRGARGRMLDLFGLERHCLTSAMRVAAPDIIHAHWSYEFGAAALDSGLPCLLTCHDSPWAILKTKTDLYRVGRLLMARSVLRRARHATVVSPYLVDELNGMTDAPLVVVPNPMPNEVLQAGTDRTVRDFRAAPPKLAMLLNGWGPRKNPQPGMLAMRSVAKTYSGAQMHLFGPDFGLGEQAQQWAIEQGIADLFIFHGWTPHNRVMHELAGMDLLVHPAVEESFGMTIAEAMALGIPMIAGRASGAVPWVLGEGSEEMLVDIRSADAIADAALGLLNDAHKYRHYSKQGRDRANARFSASAVAEAYMLQYQKILNAQAVERLSRGLPR